MRLLSNQLCSARTREESAVNECLNPCTVRCFHFLHGGVDRQTQWNHLKKHHKYYFPWERDFGSESRLGKRPFLQGPTLNFLGVSYAGKQERHMFRNFKVENWHKHFQLKLNPSHTASSRNVVKIWFDDICRVGGGSFQKLATGQ